MGIEGRGASHEWDEKAEPKEAAGDPGMGMPPPEPERFRADLLEWYDRNRRPLPWRETRDPYRIWVSEVMLQQTRVEVVIPRYLQFVGRFSSLAILAAAAESEVLAAWSGLGYYRRARNLHAAARMVSAEHHGEFPRKLDQALALPGVGSYIGRAVLSIAYGTPCGVVDGNVRRVIARLLCQPDPSPATLQREADRLLDPLRPGDANQAMMELGATVCGPASPQCAACPVRSHCAAERLGRTGDVPTPKARPAPETRSTVIYILRDSLGRIWLESRHTPPLEGLWMLPWRGVEGSIRSGNKVGTITHSIMHHRYRCEVVEMAADPSQIPGAAAGPGKWIDISSLSEFPHPSLIEKAIALLACADDALRARAPDCTPEDQEETANPAISQRRRRILSNRGASDGSRKPRSA